MPENRLRKTALLLTALILATSPALAGDLKPRKIGPKDKCPVCGMFVAKYPDFAAQVQFRDGSVLHFDGAKDLFKYYLDLPRFAPGRKAADISAILVTDYYDLGMVDAFAAYFVVGSNVYGPMGRELIPFGGQSKARDFLADHKGKSIARFHEITPALLRQLD